MEKRGRGRPKGGSLAAQAQAIADQLEQAARPQASPELLEKLAALELAYERQRFQKLDFFNPYPKQVEFFTMGATKFERLLIAGNQVGKTEAGAFEAAVHLTGLYPSWWQGRRFSKPVAAWAACDTGMNVRDAAQAKLCGKPGVEADFGTGTIPKKHFVAYPSSSRGVADGFDTIQVKHVSGGVSTLTFKSYEQGRTRFQGATLDFIWCDEEPPIEVYMECVARTTATNGMLFTTFTPLYGSTEIVARFLEEDAPKRGTVTMDVTDAKHLTPERIKEMEDSYPAYMREARLHGIPMLGEGRIFTIEESQITEPTMEYVPPFWMKIWGIDFGILHPFAAVLLAWDRDTDVLHVLHTVRMKDALPLQHAAAMKPIGGNVPVAWPQDGTAREKGSGQSLASAYKAQELRMLGDHATWPDGGVSTEAGINEMIERMVTGRFKVAAHLTDWMDEYRSYHRKDGLIVKKKDDLLSATRIAVMAKRFAQPVLLGPPGKPKRRPEVAEGVDFDLFH